MVLARACMLCSPTSVGLSLFLIELNLIERLTDFFTIAFSLLFLCNFFLCFHVKFKRMLISISLYVVLFFCYFMQFNWNYNGFTKHMCICVCQSLWCIKYYNMCENPLQFIYVKWLNVAFIKRTMTFSFAFNQFNSLLHSLRKRIEFSLESRSA